jgi:hypothetical protein
MTTVLAKIPEHLKPEIDAALSWFNTREGADFEVTGIVDPPASAGAGQDLRLVLCGSGTCRQETFRVGSSANGPQIDWLGDNQSKASSKVAELDPPPGPLRQWIDEVSGRHTFTVLLFYRGFW